MLASRLVRTLSKVRFAPTTRLPMFSAGLSRRFSEKGEEGESKEQKTEEKTLDKEFTAETLSKDTLHKLIQRVSGQEKSNVYTTRLVQEIEHLTKARDESRVLKDTVKTFDTLRDKDKKVLEELKRRLEENETDKTRMRERLQGEVEKEKVFAISKFAKDVVEIIDNLERAIKHATEEEKKTNLYQGLELTLHQALQTLNRFGVTTIEDPIGKKFDANHHMVVFETASPKHEAGTVVHVLSKGYVLKDRLLRAATVGVAK